MLFISWALLGATVTSILLFVVGVAMGASSSSNEPLFSCGMYLLLFPGGFLIPVISLLTGAGAVLYDCMVGKSVSEGRRNPRLHYLRIALMSTIVGIALLPGWLMSFPDLQLERLRSYCADGLIHARYKHVSSQLEPIKKNYNELERLCFWTAIVERGIPFVIAFPALSILLLLHSEQQDKKHDKSPTSP